MNPRTQAIASVRASLGLSDDPTTWTYDERISYNRALATYIQRNPQIFSASEVTVARDISAQNSSPLESTGFLSDLSVFGEALKDEAIKAGESVAGVGQGVLAFASLTKWLIPLAGIIAVGILLFALKKKVA